MEPGLLGLAPPEPTWEELGHPGSHHPCARRGTRRFGAPCDEPAARALHGASWVPVEELPAPGVSVKLNPFSRPALSQLLSSWGGIFFCQP